MKEDLWKRLAAILLPLILAIASYANTFSHQFVYDDRFQIVEAAPVLDNWQGENLKRLVDRDIWGFFTQEFSWQGTLRSQYYRPLFGLLYMINYKLFKLNPVGWHTVALLLHLLATFLAYQMIVATLFSINRSPLESRIMASFAAAIFAIHPAQSETVAWVAADVNSLSTIFIFSSIIAYLQTEKPHLKWWQKLCYLLISCSAYSFALLTKEMAIILPVLIFIYQFTIINSTKSLVTKLINVLPFILVTLLYLAIRIAIFGSIRVVAINSDFPDLKPVTLLENIYTIPSLLLNYLMIFSWPFNLNPMYACRLITNPTWQNFLLPAIIIGILVAVALYFIKKDLIVRIALIWLVVPMLPVLDIRSFKPEDLIHDRYLYTSLIGGGLLIAYLGHQISTRLEENRRSLIAIAGLAILLIFSITTFRGNEVWANEWQLWSAAQSSLPDSCTVNLELGRLYDDGGNFADAKFYYEKAKLSCPNSAMLYYKIGLIYGRTGDLVNAEQAFLQLAQLANNPFIRATACFNLGLIYEKQGKVALAIKSYQEGLRLNPRSKMAAQVKDVITELEKRTEILKDREQ